MGKGIALMFREAFSEIALALDRLTAERTVA